MKIAIDNVLQLLRQAIDEKDEGDQYVDPNASAGAGCLYTDGEDPVCIVGTVFYLVGVSLADLMVMDKAGDLITVSSYRYGDYEIEDDYVPYYSREDYLPASLDISYEAIVVLRAAQKIQDEGGTWGEAYGEAVRTHKELMNAR